MKRNPSRLNFWLWFSYAVACSLIVIVRIYTWKPIH